MAKERIQVYTEGTKLKERIDAFRGNYHITTWCFMVLEKEVERLEKKEQKEIFKAVKEAMKGKKYTEEEVKDIINLDEEV